MNILYDHTIFQNQEYGGISRYFHELISRLTLKANTNVNLFQGLHVNKYNWHPDIYNKYYGYKPNLNIPSIYKSYSFVIPNKILFHTLYKFSNDFDIYHPTYYSQGLSKHHKKPIVVTVYDMIHEIFPGQLKFGNYFIKVKKEAIFAADKIICISNNTKKDLMEIYDIPEDKIEVIYLASSLKKCNTSINLTEKYGINKPYLLYVGDRNAVYKNFSTLLDAYTSSLKNRFDMVCFGGGPFNKQEASIIKKARCNRSIFQLSGSDYVLTSLYQNAHAYVCPSLYEGFGLPLLEAMGSGCPVIAANTSSIPEVVGDAAILFDTNTTSSITKAIESLKNISRNNLIERGFKQEQKFNWNETAKKTQKLYEELICQKPH